MKIITCCISLMRVPVDVESREKRTFELCEFCETHLREQDRNSSRPIPLPSMVLDVDI